jgi:hypothetical protein
MRALDGAESAANAPPPAEIAGLFLFRGAITAGEEVELLVCKLSQRFFQFLASQFNQLLG